MSSGRVLPVCLETIQFYECSSPYPFQAHQTVIGLRLLSSVQFFQFSMSLVFWEWLKMKMLGSRTPEPQKAHLNAPDFGNGSSWMSLLTKPWFQLNHNPKTNIFSQSLQVLFSLHSVLPDLFRGTTESQGFLVPSKLTNFQIVPIPSPPGSLGLKFLKQPTQTSSLAGALFHLCVARCRRTSRRWSTRAET